MHYVLEHDLQINWLWRAPCQLGQGNLAGKMHCLAVTESCLLFLDVLRVPPLLVCYLANFTARFS
jgi:hypothetical protein